MSLSEYGVENFSFEVLLEVNSLEEADAEEIELISFYNSDNRDFGYNKSPGGQGQRLTSPETINKISKSLKGMLAKEKHPMWGKHHTSETKEKLRKANLGNKHRLGFKTSDETRKKLSKINKGKKATPDTIEKMSKSMMGKNAGVKNGMFGVRGENHVKSKLTFEIANEIRKRYKEEEISMSKLAQIYGVSKRSILNIIHNRTYCR